MSGALASLQRLGRLQAYLRGAGTLSAEDATALADGFASFLGRRETDLARALGLISRAAQLEAVFDQEILRFGCVLEILATDSENAVRVLPMMHRRLMRLQRIVRRYRDQEAAPQ